MSDFAELERQIEQRLAAAKAKHVLYQGHLRERMQEIDREQQKRDELTSRARGLAESAIRPRMAKLASYFDNAELRPASQTSDERCVCSFQHTERFPATTKLEFTVRPEADSGQIGVSYRLEILPIFFEFEHEDQLLLSGDALEDQAVTSWIDKKLLQFMDTYLKLQEIDPYQHENLVTDPVCGMRINKTSAAGEAKYHGRTYYFCVDECRRLFLEEPRRYVKELQ